MVNINFIFLFIFGSQWLPLGQTCSPPVSSALRSCILLCEVLMVLGTAHLQEYCALAFAVLLETGIFARWVFLALSLLQRFPPSYTLCHYIKI